MEFAGEQAVQAVAEAGDDEHYERPEIAALHQVNHDERNENHPQKSELVGSGEYLGKLHARSSEACDPERGTSLAFSCNFSCGNVRGASAVDGSSLVLAKKRWESEGRLPSGRSSSTRSMRCMGKNTTAGVKGSPSRTMTVRSSNDASSAPLRLRPLGERARIIPQNFSRGLHRVAMTRAPGWNGSRIAAGAGPLPGEWFSTLRLSPGEGRIANPLTT